MALVATPGASLRALNTFHVEAHASLLIEIDDAADVVAARELLGDTPPALILGGGSNLLLTGDLAGTVLRLRSRGIAIEAERDGAVTVRAAAGENWHDLVRWTLAHGCHGLENLSLIPGSVGASPIQNIGAYGVEMRDRFERLAAVSLATGHRRLFDRAACGFAYRHSVFKRPDHRDWLITDVWFRLHRTPTVTLAYAELRDELAVRGITAPTPLDVSAAVCDIRRRKLPDPATLGNAGSFFKNPLVPRELAERLRSREPGLPVHPSGDASDPRVKLSAGWLIDRCGWKGYRAGDAGVHERHALVLVNHGSATGADLLALAGRIQRSVHDTFGIDLESEPVIL